MSEEEEEDNETADGEPVGDENEVVSDETEVADDEEEVHREDIDGEATGVVAAARASVPSLEESDIDSRGQDEPDTEYEDANDEFIDVLCDDLKVGDIISYQIPETDAGK